MREVIKRIRNKPLPSKVTLQDVHREINIQKEDIRQLKGKLNEVQKLIQRVENLELGLEVPKKSADDDELKFQNEIDSFVNSITKIPFQKWHTKVIIKVKDIETEATCLLDSGANINVIREGLIPTKYFQKTNYSIHLVNAERMNLK